MLFFPRRPQLLKILRWAVTLSFCFIFVYLNRAWFLNNGYKSTTRVLDSNKASNVAPNSTPVAVPTAPFPEKLWYKLGPNGLNSELQGYIDTCVNANPTVQHEFMTDASGDAFVKEHFRSHPDIIETFLAIRIPIIKADILRYLILYENGGIWNDLDVSCEDVPIHEWIPAQYKEKAAIVVGLEFDVDIWVRQFASWTIMAKAKSPHMWQVVEDCFEAIHAKTKEHNVGVGELTRNITGDVVDFSGPRRLTRGILKSLSSTLQREVGNEDIAHVAEPRLIGDVLVLPDYAFANSMNEEYGDKRKGRKLVTHHYAGSWKNDRGGETPVNEAGSS